MSAQNYLTDGPKDAQAVVILAHGAGAPMDSPFMDAYASGIAAAGDIDVFRLHARNQSSVFRG